MDLAADDFDLPPGVWVLPASGRLAIEQGDPLTGMLVFPLPLQVMIGEQRRRALGQRDVERQRAQGRALVDQAVLLGRAEGAFNDAALELDRTGRPRQKRGAGFGTGTPSASV